MASRIVIDKRIMHGKSVVRGTRVPVDIVVGSLAGGMTFKEIEEEYGILRKHILVVEMAALEGQRDFRRYRGGLSEGILSLSEINLILQMIITRDDIWISNGLCQRVWQEL